MVTRKYNIFWNNPRDFCSIGIQPVKVIKYEMLVGIQTVKILIT